MSEEDEPIVVVETYTLDTGKCKVELMQAMDFECAQLATGDAFLSLDDCCDHVVMELTPDQLLWLANAALQLHASLMQQGEEQCITNHTQEPKLTQNPSLSKRTRTMTDQRKYTEITQITRAMVFEVDTHRFVADASELGLAPGCFPAQIKTQLGNGRPFIRRDVTEQAVTYSQANGCISLLIFND